MAKRGFVLRVRNHDGSWSWLNPECPMTKHAAEQWKLINRCDGIATQIWPENEALEVMNREKGPAE